MPDPKQKTGADSAGTAADSSKKPVPASAPELTDDQKQQIETSLRVERDDPVGKTVESKPAAKQAGTPESDAVADDTVVADTDGAQRKGRVRQFFAAYWNHKKWSIPLTLLVLLAAAFYILPKYVDAAAALVMRDPYVVTVTDAGTKKPVSSAEVSIDGKTALTDKDGKATFKVVKLGNRTLAVSKKYYESYSVRTYVSLERDGWSPRIAIKATGRQVPVSVVNKLTGKPLADVTFKAAGTEVKSDKDGKATIVLPADKPDLPVELSNGGFNELRGRLVVTDAAVKENTFALVPTGKLYFLSRQSGKIDVVKTDLDGANRQTVIYGTGKEDDRGTVLLASRDWKYLALHSKRDSTLPKLYLIDTSNDKMTEMDSGDAQFTLVGWNEHDFVYKVQRNAIKFWQPNHLAFKSFNADKKQILTIDQSSSNTEGEVTYYQAYGNPYIIGDKLVYSVIWSYYGNYLPNNLAGRNHSLRVASVNTVSKRDVKTWAADQFDGYIRAALYNPDELYVGLYSREAKKEVFFEYENGAVKDANIDEDKFNFPYATYLQSPSSKQTFWSETRDGRPTFFVGDGSGENGKQVAVLDESQVYGWYGNDYMLTSKKGSELYILPVSGGTPLKVADYHKPQLSYRGYGGGYGGL